MKLQRISEFQHEFSFLSSQENLSSFYACFLQSDLGKIYIALPWDSLVERLNIKEKQSSSKMMLSPKGRIGLMFLKHYSCCLDTKNK